VCGQSTLIVTRVCQLYACSPDCIDTYTIRNVLPSEADFHLLPPPSIALVGSKPLLR
jgi:hypothetical protein